jgi:hypothetical protein
MKAPSGVTAVAVSSCMPPRSTPALVNSVARLCIPVAAVQRNACELLGIEKPAALL